MEGFWRSFDKLLDGMVVLAGVLLVFITAGMCYTIFMRYFFTQTTIWIIPACEYALLWIVFLSTTWLLREGGHITTDIIYIHLNEKAKHYLNFTMSVIGGLACAVMVVFGTIYMCNCIAHSVTDVRSITIPKWTVFCIIPLGFTLLTIQFFRMARSRFVDIKEGR
ncbi:MAG: hypothetical protein A2Y65_10695 [Deltaproteobacteria bacterium RBG_13_52_11]|nr:MAG: hypothetical protein A2Y65_10695 [Deltaproteobacteria bacterium RBG_13_52_11]